MHFTEDDAPVHLNWTAPAIWPHAVSFVAGLRLTSDKSAVTCSACLWALGSQKHEPPTPIPPGAQ